MGEESFDQQSACGSLAFVTVRITWYKSSAVRPWRSSLSPAGGEAIRGPSCSQAHLFARSKLMSQSSEGRAPERRRREAPLATPTDLAAGAAADYVEPIDMLAELREDNQTLAARLREAHNVCDEHRDIASASLIEVWIDETERRTWFLFESSRHGDSSGH